MGVEHDLFIYQSCAPIPVMTPASEVPVQSELFNHRYHRGRWRSRRPDGVPGWIEQDVWLYEDIWLYKGLGK